MIVSQIAKRYGLAIFQLSVEKSFLDELLSFLKESEKLFIQEEVVELFKNPLIPFSSKKAAVDELVKGEREEIKNFMELLLRKNRILLLPEIARFVEELELEQEKKVSVEVVSAAALSEEKLKEIADSVSRLAEGSVILSTKVDPELIGGVIVKYRDVVIDGSLKRYLEEVKKIIQKGKR